MTPGPASPTDRPSLLPEEAGAAVRTALADGDTDRAIRLCAAAIRETPDAHWPHALLCTAYLQKAGGRDPALRALARREFDRAVETAPPERAAHDALIGLAQTLGVTEALRERYRGPWADLPFARDLGRAIDSITLIALERPRGGASARGGGRRTRVGAVLVVLVLFASWGASRLPPGWWRGGGGNGRVGAVVTWGSELGDWGDLAFLPDDRVVCAGYNFGVHGTSPNTPGFVARGVGSLTMCAEPDGSRVVLCCNAEGGNDAHVLRGWDAASGWSWGPIASPYLVPLRWSPDGTCLAAGGGETNLAYLLDPANGSVLRTFSGHSGLIRDLDFSHDGRCLVTASLDGSIRAWDTSSGAALWSVSAWPEETTCVRWLHDGRVLAAHLGAGSGDALLTLLAGETGAVLGVIPALSRRVDDLAVCRGAERLVTAGEAGQAGPGNVRVWDLRAGQLVAGPVFPLKGQPRGVAINKAGTWAAVATDRAVHLYDLAALARP